LPVNNFIQSKNGPLIQTISCLNKEFLCYMQPFSSSLFYTGQKEELLQVPFILRKLERATIDLNKLPIKRAFQKPDLQKVYQHLKRAEFQDNQDEFDQYLLENSALIKATLEQLEQSNCPTDEAVYHCDLHPHNILTVDGRISSIIDLESFIIMPREIFW